MNRATWLQDRRMQKFRDVLSRWEGKELSAMEAAEILGVSERQFRRYRRRYEEEGLAGLVDRRAGKSLGPSGAGRPAGLDDGRVSDALPGLEREAFPRAHSEAA
jgi:transposase